VTGPVASAKLGSALAWSVSSVKSRAIGTPSPVTQGAMRSACGMSVATAPHTAITPAITRSRLSSMDVVLKGGPQNWK
jgi:hypothetical protein